MAHTLTRTDHPAERFDAVRAVADAVLYEGYLLYPYRRSSAKNQVRWQFGVLAPQAWIEAAGIPDAGVAGSAESWFQQAECLLEPRQEAEVEVCVRFLQHQRKQVLAPDADGALVPVDRLDAGDESHLSFDEARAREHVVRFALRDLLQAEQVETIETPAERDETSIRDAAGAEVGRLERTARPLTAVVRASAERAETPFPAARLRVRLENAMGVDDPHGSRPEVLSRSMLASHLMFGLSAGRFLSLLDPPAWAAPAAASCTNRHVFPVLAGDVARATTMLCAPIILPDDPRVAPESPGDLHDAAEIDEILSLRTLTLTDDEKREARATDPRAAAIIDRVDAMPPEMLAKLHGAVRSLRPVARVPAQPGPEPEPEWWRPGADASVDPETDSVLVAGVEVTRGSRVRLHPRRHGTDAHDMFLAGRTALVQSVLRDVEGPTYVAVTVEDDPGADLYTTYRRHLHFSPDEIEPLDLADGA